MRFPKLALVLGLALSSFAVASPSRAQTSSADTPDGYIYNFKDDKMLGSTMSGNMAILKVRIKSARATLIRPRASFVPEMLESVELM